MAVVSISRIQVRRGTTQGTGLPQLASGEFGWAIDTQELYIGNGSTSEGAPAVGNTQILTAGTNILNLAKQYTYREDEVDGAAERTLAQRLDDQVSARSFGIFDTTLPSVKTQQLQKAFYELFLRNNTVNPGDPATTNVPSPVLYIDPGIYEITQTIYVPPFTTVIGAGKDKTVFKKTGDFDMFRTISSQSTYNNGIASPVFEPEIEHQARKIRFEHMTLESTVASSTSRLLLLDNCRNSIFENVKFIDRASSRTEVGLGFASKNSLVSSNNNEFVDCDFEGLKDAAYGKCSAKGNNFIRCTFSMLERGVTLGENDSNSAENNTIVDSDFDDINQYAFLTIGGRGNKSRDNKYGANVGNNDTSESAHPIISYDKTGNFSIDDIFERTNSQSLISGSKYYPEVEGPVSYTISNRQTTIVGSGTALAFRLSADATKFYNVDYFFTTVLANGVISFRRYGTLTVIVDVENKEVNVVDDYDFIGNDGKAGGAIRFKSEFEYEIEGDTTSDILAVKILSESIGAGPLINYDVNSDGTIDPGGEPGGVGGELTIEISSKS